LKRAEDWLLDLTCSSCGEERGTTVTLDPTKTVESNRGRKSFHLILKCPSCGREQYVTVKENSERDVSGEVSEEWQSVLQLDCRGVDVSGWHLGQYVLTTPSGMRVPDADLTDGDFADFDEDLNKSVEVLEAETRVI
jgi:endogenous inhibitor of DNA gyrase (YacG/DUF329 family)